MKRRNEHMALLITNNYDRVQYLIKVYSDKFGVHIEDLSSDVNWALAKTIYSDHYQENTFDNNKVFLGWAKVVVYNNCLNLLRRSPLQSDRYDDIEFISEADHKLVTYQPDYADREILKNMNRLIEECFPEITGKIWNFFLDGLSFPKIGLQLNIHEGHVKAHVYRVRQFFMKKYGKAIYGSQLHRIGTSSKLSIS